MRSSSITPTVSVIVRHSSDCPDKNKGSDWRRCGCPKSILVYQGGGSGNNRRISAKTRSWEKAEKFAQDYSDSFDPEKQELRRLRAAEQQKQIRIEQSIDLYLKDMIARLGDNVTVSDARALLEHGLCEGLEKLPTAERPVHISEVTPAHLITWRSSWKLADSTARVRWGSVRSFFLFCEGQGWVSDSPARRIRAPKVSHGGRTAIFTDDQYTAIQNAAHDEQRLVAFVELLRWSGMAITDGVQYRPEQVDHECVLRYRRHKTGTLATVPLPAHVVAILRDVPLEPDSVGSAQPFRTKDNVIKSDVRRWQRHLGDVFKRAGIAEVRTESGKTRPPHPHMLRDTFAVWNLRHGASTRAVAKMLGHSSVRTTEEYYLPWVKELEEAHIAEGRKVLEQGLPKANTGENVVNIARQPHG